MSALSTEDSILGSAKETLESLFALEDFVCYSFRTVLTRLGPLLLEVKTLRINAWGLAFKDQWFFIGCWVTLLCDLPGMLTL